MNPQKAEKLFQVMRRYGVEHFKTLDIEIKMGVELGTPEVKLEKSTERPADPRTETVKTPIETKRRTKPPTAAAIPPVEMPIPHHVNEVSKLLKLSDEDLVDKMFPDYTQKKDGN